ncbi:DUF6240 domain-containing protein [Butyrivibrio sp. AE3004]|uniref:DUF6240 domain-containing protein n=1 Tax=Butyrivibrio sp. AE3004 TaxID=1506994 RepID=UPI0004940776|nr:DUF6240 domain-containing protein [Butyrivibrio sp. AE3004]
MSVNFNVINGMESDLEKSRKSTEAGNIYTKPYQKSTGTKSAVSVDLNGSLINNEAYTNQGKSKNDIMMEASNTDAALRHNYMSIMANNMSAEDFARAREDGFNLSDMKPEETVTILDKIKATLAMSGTEVIGYTDDITADQLTKITGSSSLANEIISSFHNNDIPLTKENIDDVILANDKMKSITELSDGAIKYMTLNDLAPTIENLYMSEHATNGQNRNGGTFILLETEGYYAKKADRLDWNTVEDQAKRIIAETGYDPEDSEILEQTKWMIEESIPLTKENLEKVSSLKMLNLPMDEEKIVNLTALSIANRGMVSADGSDNIENNIKKAIEIAGRVEKISDDAVDKVIEDNKVVNLDNLYRSQLELDKERFFSNKDSLPKPVKEQKEEMSATLKKEQPEENNTLIDEYTEKKMEVLTARKQLEEIRLSMTVNANLRLIDKGIKLETEPINNVIEALTKEIEDINKEIFNEGGTEKYQLFEETTAKISEFWTLPIAVVGRHSLPDNDSFENLYDDAKSLKVRYDKAGVLYEAVGTQVRGDLGDSIRKAFRNIDELLREAGQEINEENRRVIRILGYNRMEINEENIVRVLEMDEKLMRTVEKLKPGAVLNMIKEGHNPLKMTLQELGNELSRQDKDTSQQYEKYSKFLYKMEKNDEITPEEKESYIGIYRLFNTLKVTDNAAIGAVLQTGAEMTIENLLTATRTAKKEKKGIDFKVDDSFGGVTTKVSGSKSISEQIETAFRHYSEKADLVYENLEPEKLHNINAKEEMLLDELSDRLKEQQDKIAKDNIEAEYLNEKVNDIRKVASSQTSEDAIKELTKMGIEANTDTILAFLNLKAGRKGRDSSVWNLAEKMATLAFKEVRQDMLDDLIREEDYSKAYEENLLNLSDSLNEMLINEADTYIDVKTIHLMQKQLSVASKMSRNESYEIPVEIDGKITSMYVTFKESEMDGSKVEAEIETEYYGHISMGMTIDEGEVRGAFAASLKQTDDLAEYMDGVKDRFIRELSEKEAKLTIEKENIGILYRRQEAGSAIQGSEKGIFDKRTLLRMAEIFVHSV